MKYHIQELRDLAAIRAKPMNKFCDDDYTSDKASFLHNTKLFFDWLEKNESQLDAMIEHSRCLSFYIRRLCKLNKQLSQNDDFGQSLDRVEIYDKEITRVSTKFNISEKEVIELTKEFLPLHQ